jgi:hypothetical protein
VAAAEENRYYSHDHGWYFPPEGPTWDVQSLDGAVDVPHDLAVSASGIAPDLEREVARAVQGVNRDSIRGILGAVPATWPVSDAELEVIGFFIERRAPAVASRLVARVGGIP